MKDLIIIPVPRSITDKILRRRERFRLIYKNIELPGKFYEIPGEEELERLSQLHVKNQPENLLIYRPQRFDIRELIRGSSEYFGGPLETINCGEVYIDGVLQEGKYYIFQNKLHVMPS